MTNLASEEQASRNGLLVGTLVIGTMAISVSITMLQLFLVDIGSTFKVSVGIASQLATANHAGEFISALLMGALAIRFRYRSLILAGMLLVLFSAMGSFLAPNFMTLQVFFVIEGLGTVMFSVMSFTVVGDVFEPQRRAKAVSYLMAALFGMALISFPLSGFIANVWGWRFNFILQMLPIGFAGLLLAIFFVSSGLRKETAGVERSYLKTFRQVLTDKSAFSCLLGGFFASAGSTIAIFRIAFYREVFSVSLGFTVLVAMFSWGLFILGSLVSGRLTNRFGAKPTTVTATVLAGVFTMLLFFIPSLLGVLVFNFLTAIVAAVGVTSAVCLALAQVPGSRATMMSLNGAVEALGTTTGPAVGGLLLVFASGSYGAVGLALGSMFFASAIIIFLLAKDPDRT